MNNISEISGQSEDVYVLWIPKWKIFRPPTWKIFKWAYMRILFKGGNGLC